jgi:predicted unusual protein kinase regulating ubiquinone biosynthesis (AarF/ABC1/UbiB family)
MLERFNAELPPVMKENPLIEVPADILLIGRVSGLLSGIGKQLGSTVDIGAALLPYLAMASGEHESGRGEAGPTPISRPASAAT